MNVLADIPVRHRNDIRREKAHELIDALFDRVEETPDWFGRIGFEASVQNGFINQLKEISERTHK